MRHRGRGHREDGDSLDRLDAHVEGRDRRQQRDDAPGLRRLRGSRDERGGGRRGRRRIGPGLTAARTGEGSAQENSGGAGGSEARRDRRARSGHDRLRLVEHGRACRDRGDDPARPSGRPEAPRIAISGRGVATTRIFGHDGLGFRGRARPRAQARARPPATPRRQRARAREEPSSTGASGAGSDTSGWKGAGKDSRPRTSAAGPAAMNRSSGTCRTISSSGSRMPFGRRSAISVSDTAIPPGGTAARSRPSPRGSSPPRAEAAPSDCGISSAPGCRIRSRHLVQRDAERFHGKLRRHAARRRCARWARRSPGAAGR